MPFMGVFEIKKRSDEMEMIMNQIIAPWIVFGLVLVAMGCFG